MEHSRIRRDPSGFDETDNKFWGLEDQQIQI